MSEYSERLEALRLKHKTQIVDHAFSIYKPNFKHQKNKQHWVNFLLESNDIRQLIHALKNDVELPVSIQEEHHHVYHGEKGEVKIIDNDLSCRSGDKKKVKIEVFNNSDEVWQTTPEEPRFASYHWYKESGEIFLFDGLRTEIPEPISPRESLSFDLNVNHPTEPGTYFLGATLVLEGICWMEENGLKTERKRIVVEEYDGRGLTRHARTIYHDLKSLAIKKDSICA